MPRDLSSFFHPNSIAIVGASNIVGKVGYIVLQNIIDAGFKGNIYPVNPKEEIISNKKCYKDVASIPEVVDLVVMAVPAEISLNLVSQIVQKGIKNIVMYASGFKESGTEGKILEQKLFGMIKENNLNILGPNCFGFVNNNANLNATFGQQVKQKGNIKFISQSGAIASSIFDFANSIELGFSDFITLGNKTDLNEIDILEYYKKLSEEEGNTSNFSIGMYLESISNGAEFIRLTSKLCKKHPIFIIKPGKTIASSNAMKSHTGSMTGQDAVFEAALKKAGVIRCDTLEEFFDYIQAFEWAELPKGPNVAIISNAGGPSVISSDAVSIKNLKLATFDEVTLDKLKNVLPKAASINNPIDVMGDATAQRYMDATQAIIEGGAVDSILFLLTPQTNTEIAKTAEYISEISKRYQKSIVCSFIGGDSVLEGTKILSKNKIPCFSYPENAIQTISTMWGYVENVKITSEIKNIDILVASVTTIATLQEDTVIMDLIENAISKNYKSLDNIDADSVIKHIGIQTPKTTFISTFEDALEFVSVANYPVVLKLSGPNLLHKKEVGGVITKINNESNLKDAFSQMHTTLLQLSSEGMGNLKIQIQQQISDGVEIILGLKKDDVFGSFILFGAGGSFVEIINDKNIHILPVDIKEATNLIEDSKIYKIIKKAKLPIDKLAEAIVNFSKLSLVIPDNIDVEINPLIVTASDVWAVDSKVVFKTTERNI